jgi:hypothetical protein
MFEFLNNVKNYVVSYWNGFWKYQVTDLSNAHPDAIPNQVATAITSTANASPDSHTNSEENTSRRRRRRRKKNNRDSQAIEPANNAPEHNEYESIEPETHSSLPTVEVSPSPLKSFALPQLVPGIQKLDSESGTLEHVDEPRNSEEVLNLTVVSPAHSPRTSDLAQAADSGKPTLPTTVSQLPKLVSVPEKISGTSALPSAMKTTAKSSVSAIVLPKSEPVGAKKKSDVVSPRKRAVKKDKSPLVKTVVSEPNNAIEQKTLTADKEISTATVMTSSSSPTFFSPASKKNTTVSSLQRSQLPKTMMDLIDKLRGQFPSARFFITGAAPADIMDNLKPNDYDLLIVDKSSIYEINQFLNLQNYRSEIRSVKYPVIFCEVDKGLTLDFSVIISSDKLSTKQLLENDFKKRDFNLNAFYCELTHEDNFEIFSFSDALGDRNKKIISFNNNEANPFEQDPTRLFRLCNLLIKHPDYSLHKQIKEALISLKKVENGVPRWYTVFSDYVRLAHGNGDRLTHAIRKLFVRHSYKNINNALHRLSLLTSFTDNSKTAADYACSKIPSVTPDSKLIMWLMANVLERFESGKKDQGLPINPLLYLYPLEHQHLAYAYSHGPKAPTLYPVLRIPPIETLISKFKLPEKDAPSVFPTFLA